MSHLCADSIAKEPAFQQLEPWAQPIAAGREFISRIERHVSLDENFIVETTMSGRTLRNFLLRAKEAQFSITIFFVCLNSIRQKRASPGFVSEFAAAGTTFPRPISAAAFPAVWRISGKSIVKLPIIGTSFTIQRPITNGSPQATQKQLTSIMPMSSIGFSKWREREMIKPTVNAETLMKGEKLMRIAHRAAQEENRRLGIPNVYAINGFLYYELPSGELSREDPYKK